MSVALPWDFALILLVLAIVVPWRGTRRVRELLARPVLSSSDRIAMYSSTIGFQWVATGFTVWRVHARFGTTPFVMANLGLALPHPVRAITVGAGLSLVIAVSQVLSLQAVSRLPAERRGKLFEIASKLMPHTLIEALPFLALVCTVSVCEEFLYRGFAFAVLGEVFGAFGSGRSLRLFGNFRNWPSLPGPKRDCDDIRTGNNSCRRAFLDWQSCPLYDGALRYRFSGRICRPTRPRRRSLRRRSAHDGAIITK